MSSISTTINHGITLGSGGYTSPLTVTSTGTVKNNGTGKGIFGGAATVVNNGHILVTGNSGGYGYQGIYLGSGYVNNAGTITAAGNAVLFQGTGSIVNSGFIYGGRWGITSRGLTSITNIGTVSGGSEGIVLSGGGFINNSKLISGADGVGIGGAAGTVVNSGTIVSYGAGVALNAGGVVSNTGTGLISITGLYAAIYITGGAGSVTNGGTLSGYFGAQFVGTYDNTLIDTGTIVGSSGTAVAFSSGNDLLRFSPSTSIAIQGTVDGGGGTNTLEFASGATTGTLTGLSAAFVNFTHGTIDSGASWVFAGDNTLGASVTLTNSGTLSDSGTLINAGRMTGTAAGVILTNGARVTNQSGGTIGGSVGVYAKSGAATVVNAGSITGTGTSGFGVRFGSTSSGGSIINQSGGAIAGAEDAVYVNTGAGTGTVSNFGIITGGSTGFAGINLSAGGSIANASGGTITGHSAGVFIANGTAAAVSNAGSIGASQSYGVWLLNAGTVTNASGGRITGGYTAADAAGVYLGNGGAVTNQSGGTIGGLRGVYVLSGAATVVNAGHIVGSGTTIGAGAADTGIGVYLGAGGSITNQSGGTISGYDGVWAANSAVTVVNTGAIIGNLTAGNAAGVYLLAGGSVTNQSGGTIIGRRGIYVSSGAAGTVVNAGSIGSYQGGAGVQLKGGGSVTNQSGGRVSAGTYGVVIAAGTSAAASAINVSGGTIIAAIDAMRATDGTVVNQGYLSGGRHGIFIDGGGAGTNETGGFVSAALDGVVLYGGGSFTNQSGGTFDVGRNGLFFSSGAGTAVNQGAITAASRGIWLGTGGSVTNASGGLITASANGIVLYSYGSVTNASGGTISASIDGIQVNANSPATVVNQGSISAGDLGIILQTRGIQTTNQGIITAGTAGVYMQHGGLVTNTTGGKISGANFGVYSQNGIVTVVNAGTIAGTGAGAYAIKFDDNGYANRLIMDPGAVFTGTVAGGITTVGTDLSTVELAPGTTAGTLSGLGTKYIEFPNIVVDTGATWILASDVLPAGYTITDSGSLTNKGTLYSPVTMTTGAVLTNASGGTISGYDGVWAANGAVTVVNAGVIRGNNTYGTTFATVASGGSTYYYAYVQFPSLASGVFLQAGGAITNLSGGTIRGYDGVKAGAAATVVNTGLITGSKISGTAVSTTVSNGSTYFNTATPNPGLAAGVYLQGGGAVTNQSGGTITGYFGVKASTVAATVVNAGIIAGNYKSNYNNANGVYLTAGGSVTNQASGDIYARNDGVLITGARGTVTNLGTIHSHIGGYGGRGVSLDAGGIIINGAAGGTASTALIEGYNYAIQFGATGTDTLFNYGTVYGPTGTVAVSMLTGTIINGASGATGALIKSGLGANAVQIGGVAMVTNYGTINGNAVNEAPRVAFGVSIGGNGSVASTIGNLGASALIQGYIAVYAAQNATVTNAGTMQVYQTFGGSAPLDAVVFGGGTNRLIIDPGAVFAGYVSGSGPVTVAPGGNTIVLGTANGIGTTTLELASAASAGTLNGLGVKYTGFAAVTIDSGARWTLAGANTLAQGMTLTDSGTLTDGGTLVNAGLITGAASGILLITGARVTNQSGGTITGSAFGISASGAATVVNAGLISSTASTNGDSGVALIGGSLTNQSGGKISGLYGVSSTSVVTLVNSGSISGVRRGLDITGGGAITNASGGIITSYRGVYLAGAAAGALVNFGSIGGAAAGAQAEGVELARGESVTNQSGGLITGVRGIYSEFFGATVTNAGSIVGGTTATSIGVYLQAGGTLTNQSSGTISGSADAVKLASSHTNRLAIAPGAVFSGTVDGGNTIGAASISTMELLSSASVGTLSGLGSQFIHFAQVTIDAGAQWALSGTQTGFATLTNAGRLGGTFAYGIKVGSSTSSVRIVNQSGGTIAGTTDAVYVITGAGAGTVSNSGIIAGGSTGFAGIDLSGGGNVTNASGGTITGHDGLYLLGAATVTNSGSIVGNATNGIGAYLAAGGAITNQSGGSISGGADAVKFKAGFTDRLAIAPSASFTGTVDGGNTIGASLVSTLELASAASAGTLNGLGTQFVDFAAITIDSGSKWTFSGSNSLASGITLTVGGTLTDSGTFTNAGLVTGSAIGVILTTGAQVTNQSGGTITGTAQGLSGSGSGTVVNAGVIDGSTGAADGVALSAGGTITNQSGGTISGANVGVLLTGGGIVTNASGGTIAGVQGIYAATIAATVINAGSFVGDETSGRGSGVWLNAGGTLTNLSTGLITGNYAVILQGGTAANAGTIAGNYTNGAGSGVYSNAGGLVTNQSGGTITGFHGVWGVTQALTVRNAGSIGGNGTSGHGVYLQAGGTVTNQSSGTIGGFRGIYSNGASATVVNAGRIAGNAATGTGIFLDFGGTVTNQSGGTISGGSYAVSFASGHTNLLAAAPGAVFAGAIAGGGGTFELASAASAGTLAGFGISITNFGSLVFDAGAAWTVVGNDSATGLGTLGIGGFTFGDTIDLTGIVAVNKTFASNSLVVGNGAGTYDTLAIQGAFAANNFSLTPDGSGGTDIVICFAAGTLIDTPNGEVQVEKLAVGDLVATAHNGPRAVQWIGKGKVLSTRGRRTEATPVIVHKGALGANLPHHDLRITKAHSLYIDDVLIPVEFLVNHRTIVWDDRAQEVEIYHVELESHDILIANGVPAESYRDDGNRWLFQNANSGWGLPPQTPYAPVLTGGPVVDAIWARLLALGGPRALPPMTDDPDLHLSVDGHRIDVTASHGQDRIFHIPGMPRSVRIVSRDGVPAELGIARDPRSLGVAVRHIALHRGSASVRIAAGDSRLADGFHAYEPSGDLRWTNGDASLPAALCALPGFGPLKVVVTLAGATRYQELGQAVAA